MATGIVMCGLGFGSFAFSFIAQALVNPNNLNPDPVTNNFPLEVAEKVPSLMRYLALMWTILSIIGIVMTFPGPKPKVITASWVPSQ